jgi:hypothetical protein
MNYNGADLPGTDIGNGLYEWTISSSELVLGTHTLTFYLGKYAYNNAIFLMDIFVYNISTASNLLLISQPFHNFGVNLTKEDGNYTVYDPYDLEIQIEYRDTINDFEIAGADYAVLIFDGSSYPVFNYQFNRYYFNISASNIFEGSYEIEIRFGKNNYNNASYWLNITVETLTTTTDIEDMKQPDRNAIISITPDAFGRYPVLQSYDLTVNMSYYDGVNFEYITGATTAILEFNNYNYTSNFYGSDWYGWVIPFVNLTTGNYSIRIFFGKATYDSANATLEISITSIATQASFSDITQPDHALTGTLLEVDGNRTVYIHYDLVIQVFFEDISNTIDILDASYAVSDYDGSTGIHIGGGVYTWTILKEDLQLGSSTITFNFGKLYHENASFSIDIFVYNLSTDATFDDILQPDHPLTTTLPEVDGNRTVYIHYDLVIQVFFEDIINTAAITDATYAIMDYDGSIGVHIGGGIYEWTILASNLVLGTNTLTFYFGLADFDNSSFSIDIYVYNLDTQVESQSLEQSDHQAASLTYTNDTLGYAVYLPFEVSVSLTYRDITNDLLLSGATTATLNFRGVDFTSPTVSNGEYQWVIPTNNLILGTFEVTITFSLSDYKSQVVTFNVTIRIVPTTSALESILQPSGAAGNLPYEGDEVGYRIYSPFDTVLNVSFVDTVTVGGISGATSAILSYNGVEYVSNFNLAGLYGWVLPTGSLVVGTHLINITLQLNMYQNHSLTFNVTIYPEATLIIEEILIPTDIVQGQPVRLVFRLSFDNGTENFPLVNGQVYLITNLTSTNIPPGITNATGHVVFEFNAPIGDYTGILLTIEYDGEKYGVADGSDAFTMSIEPVQIGLPDWVKYLLYLIGLLMVASVMAIPIRRNLAAKRIHYTDMVVSSATIFEDAINLQHIMIIHKSTGTALYFKSFADESLDPDLISGFLSAVQSFGKEIKSQKSLNELSYGDKVLLFSDGEYIRVTLVLGKTASPYLKRNLAEFIGKFEVANLKKLQNWKGQLNIFQEAGDLIDDVLNTSVILPHKINPDKKARKKLTRSLCKQVLSVAESLVTEERKFIFLAQLLASCIDKVKKTPPEIILALNDLLEFNVLSPIKIELMQEVEPLSEQQIRFLAERVSILPTKTDEEKQEILNQLMQVHPAEREVILSSLMQVITIKLSSSDEEIQTKKFSDVKEVKKEIKSLEKQAKKALKEDDFNESIRSYEIAELLAHQWNLSTMGKRLGQLAIATTINKFHFTMKSSIKLGRKLKKSKEYAMAVETYGIALDAAHQLFKYGFMDQEVQIKYLTGVIADLSQKEKPTGPRDYVLQANLEKLRKVLLPQWKRAQKLPKGEKYPDFVLLNHLSTRLYILSNNIFKFGVASESENLKKYRVFLDEIAQKIKDTPDTVYAAYQNQENRKTVMKQELLATAKTHEEREDFFAALITYQKILVIYYDLGDYDNAISLSSKISDTVKKLPTLLDQMQDLRNNIAELRKKGDEPQAQQQEARLALLEDAIFRPNK